MPDPELVAEGIHFPEGLAWSEADGTLVVSSVQQGAVYKVRPDERSKQRLADVGGGANNLALAVDGGVLVSQNGGLDAKASLSQLFDDIGDWPDIRSAQIGLQLVSADGTVEYVRTEGLDTPNDVVIGPDGTAYLTDPGNPFRPDPLPGRVLAWAPDGSLSTLAEGFAYCNGIALSADGGLLVTDHHGIHRIGLDGSRREWATGVSEGGVDGLTLDADGRVYLAVQRDAGVRLFEDGSEVDFLALPDRDAVVTNCCFGGEDYRSLFATDAHHSRVWRFPARPVGGLPSHLWTPVGR